MNLCSSDNHYTIAPYNQTHNLQTDEPTNTSAINFFLDFYLRNNTLYLFFFRLAYRNVNHTFLRTLKPLIILAIPYFTDFIR